MNLSKETNALCNLSRVIERQKGDGRVAEERETSQSAFSPAAIMGTGNAVYRSVVS